MFPFKAAAPSFQKLHSRQLRSANVTPLYQTLICVLICHSLIGSTWSMHIKWERRTGWSQSSLDTAVTESFFSTLTDQPAIYFYTSKSIYLSSVQSVRPCSGDNIQFGWDTEVDQLSIPNVILTFCVLYKLNPGLNIALYKIEWHLLEHLHIQKVVFICGHFFGTLHLCTDSKRLLLQYFIKGYGMYINLYNFNFKLGGYIGSAMRNL